MDRFVVFQVQNEWLVTYEDRTQVSFATRAEAEQSAFKAADALASTGHPVSVLIMPGGPDTGSEQVSAQPGRIPPQTRSN